MHPFAQSLDCHCDGIGRFDRGNRRLHQAAYTVLRVLLRFFPGVTHVIAGHRDDAMAAVFRKTQEDTVCRGGVQFLQNSTYGFITLLE